MEPPTSFWTESEPHITEHSLTNVTDATGNILPEEKSGQKVCIFHRWLLHPKRAAALLSLHLSRVRARGSHLRAPPPPSGSVPSDAEAARPFYAPLCASGGGDVTVQVSSSLNEQDWCLDPSRVAPLPRSLPLPVTVRGTVRDSPSFMGLPKPGETHVILTPWSRSCELWHSAEEETPEDPNESTSADTKIHMQSVEMHWTTPLNPICLLLFKEIENTLWLVQSYRAVIGLH